MVRPLLLAVVGLALAPLAGCGSESAGGSGVGGGGAAAGGDDGGEERIPCETDGEPCPEVACPCAEQMERFGRACADTDQDGRGDTCMSRETLCENVGCPLGGPTGSGAGGAPSTGSGDATSGGGAGDSTGTGDDTSSGTGDDTSSGSGTTTHPECQAYADGNCACGYEGQCAEGQRQELVDFCDSFFDSAYMQCAIGCATMSGTCSEKSDCTYACE